MICRLLKRRFKLYLACKILNGKNHYFIRESFQQAGTFQSRDLIDLGTDPACYIVYPGGNAFYVDGVIEDRLSELGAEVDYDELEDIFWRFVRPDIRRALESFRRREKQHKDDRKKKIPDINYSGPLHIFDKRRVHYLKFGQTDQRYIDRVPLKLFCWLHHKSRDEIEQQFMAMENELNPREFKIYTFAIFNLQQFFYESYAKNYPQMLSQEKIDEYFIEQICRLSTDRAFWSGMRFGDRLHEYLVRYVVMLFDYDYAPGSFLEDYLRQFINSRREYRSPIKRTAVSLKEASAILGESGDVLNKMSRRDLSRLYRRKAQQLHPDKGGDHETFVKLTEAYHELMRTKK